MRRIAAMVRKDLLRQVRSPIGMGFTLAFPVVFAGLIAITFGSGGETGLPRVKLLVQDDDDSLVSEFLLSATRNENLTRYFDVIPVEGDGPARMDRGEASALLRIPSGFGDALLAGRPARLELLKNPAESIMPEIAEQGLLVLADLLSTASRVLRTPLERIANFEDEAPDAATVAAIATEVHGVVMRAESLVFPPAIKLESVELAAQASATAAPGRSPAGSIFLLVLPGISVWSLFLLGDIAMRDILAEARIGTLRRQLSGPVPAWHIVAGKAAFTAVVACASLVLLTAIGGIFARRLVDLPGFVVLSAAVVLAVTGWGAVVYGVARTERQGGTVSSILLLVAAFLGGSFIQLDSLPPTLARIAPFSPFYWGTTGYRTLIVEQGALADILPNVGVLALIGAVLLAAGARMLQGKVLRGSAS